MEMITFAQFKKEALKDKKIAAEYKKLEPEFRLAEMLIKKRLEKGMTQKNWRPRSVPNKRPFPAWNRAAAIPRCYYCKK